MKLKKKTLARTFIKYPGCNFCRNPGRNSRKKHWNCSGEIPEPIHSENSWKTPLKSGRSLSWNPSNSFCKNLRNPGKISWRSTKRNTGRNRGKPSREIPRETLREILRQHLMYIPGEKRINSTKICLGKTQEEKSNERLWEQIWENLWKKIYRILITTFRRQYLDFRNPEIFSRNFSEKNCLNLG